MTKLCSMIAMASAAMLMTAVSTSTYALDLSDTAGSAGSAAGSTAGGVTGAVGGTVNGVTGPAVGAVNGVTGDNAQTTSNVGSNGELSLETRSAMADGIHAKAQALSPNRLAQLCVSAGGDAGCGSGDRSQILGIIDNRLEVIGDEQLASLCLSTGANGCGGGNSSGGANPIAALPGAAVPADDSAPGGRLSSIAAKLSNSEAIVYKKRCSSVLQIRRPTRTTSSKSASS
ncbi:MAG TPA: hypothetical protein VM144_02715 [Aestuariivirga sp.]|nr:hypothetical protein [Aestuariivirga sp.]